MGYTPKTLKNSLFRSTASTLAIYGGQVKHSTLQYREMVVKELKKRILGIRLKDQVFDNNHMNYHNYIDVFARGENFPDKEFIIVRAMAQALHRCFILISSLPEHKNKPLIKIQESQEKTRPPIILGVYSVNGKYVYLLFFYNKNLEFSIDGIKGKVQIIAYLVKSCGDKFKSRPILDLESFAILVASESFGRYISGTPTYLLTDSRVLYYLFHQKIGNSCVNRNRHNVPCIPNRYGKRGACAGLSFSLTPSPGDLFLTGGHDESR